MHSETEMILEQVKKLIKNGDINNYDIMKNNCPKDKWNLMLEEVLAEMETMRTLPAIYDDILIAENLQEKIIQYCTTRPSKIVKMYKHIDDLHYTHVSNIFKTCIRDYAKKANNRTKYSTLCKIIRVYKKACGKSDAKEIYDELFEMYSFKPAFQEELLRMKGMD